MNDNVQIIMPVTKASVVNGVIQESKIRVCAYCRVSTEEEEQLHSIFTQEDEYDKKIKENPEWTFAGIYADEGISGTDTKHRTQFMKMMQDARDGKIDLILTKSISRFGRNTMDTVNSVRELKKLGVYIKFETEGIYTKDDCEFILTMLASVAQEESRHISVNVKWNVEKRMKEGVVILNHTTFLGYTKDPETKKLVIVPEEAKIIREIYDLYTTYVGPNEICRIMERKGYKTGRGNSHWHLSLVQSILKNEKYCGDLLQQKTITTDYLGHKRAKNNDLAPKYYIKNDHEAIVSREIWDKAQEIRLSRLKAKTNGTMAIQRYLNRYPYSGLLMCAECGGPFKRRYWNYGWESQRIVYQCSNRINKESSCHKASIDSKLLEECTNHVINKFLNKDYKVFDEIRNIVNDSLTISQIELTMKNLEDKKAKITKQLSDLIDLKLNAPTPDIATIYTDKYDEYTRKLNAINNEISNLRISSIQDNTARRYDEIQKKIKEYENGQVEIDGELIHAIINKILVIDEHNIVYCIPNCRLYTNEEIRLYKSKFINYKPIFEGFIDSKRNTKYYYINYKVVVI